MGRAEDWWTGVRIAVSIFAMFVSFLFFSFSFQVDGRQETVSGIVRLYALGFPFAIGSADGWFPAVFTERGRVADVKLVPCFKHGSDAKGYL